MIKLFFALSVVSCLASLPNIHAQKSEVAKTITVLESEGRPTGVSFFGGIGVYHEYISFKEYPDDSYNAYIYRYFGNPGAALSGIKGTLGIKPSHAMVKNAFPDALYSVFNGVSLSLDLYSAEAALPFTNLDDEKKENKVSVLYYQGVVNFIRSLNDPGTNGGHKLQLGVGLGINRLTREFYGTETNGITAANVLEQQGKKTGTTNTAYLLIQFGYNFSISVVDFHFDYGYKNGQHLIELNDSRPARDENNILAKSVFFTSSYYYSLQFYLNV